MWLSVWAKERDCPHNVCNKQVSTCARQVVLNSSVGSGWLRDWAELGHHWFVLPQPSQWSFLATSLLLFYISSHWGLLQNASFFCFSAPLPPFQLLLVPASLQFLLLAAISFNGPIQLCLCMKEILLVTEVVAELDPEHLLELMQTSPASIVIQ